MHTGADPPPQRTPKLHGPRCPAWPSPYLAGVVLRRRQRRRGGWAAQSHIVPGKGGRSQLRVTSAANNEGFDRRGARPARSPAPRPPTPTPRPAWPGPAPPPPGSDYSAAGPPQQPQCRSRPPRPAPPRSAPRRAVQRPERPLLPGGSHGPFPCGSPGPQDPPSVALSGPVLPARCSSPTRRSLHLSPGRASRLLSHGPPPCPGSRFFAILHSGVQPNKTGHLQLPHCPALVHPGQVTRLEEGPERAVWPLAHCPVIPQVYCQIPFGARVVRDRAPLNPLLGKA